MVGGSTASYVTCAVSAGFKCVSGVCESFITGTSVGTFQIGATRVHVAVVDSEDTLIDIWF